MVRTKRWIWFFGVVYILLEPHEFIGKYPFMALPSRHPYLRSTLSYDKVISVHVKSLDINSLQQDTYRRCVLTIPNMTS